jgi:hypothetical protein
LNHRAAINEVRWKFKSTQPLSHGRRQNFTFSLGENSAESPLGEAFVVNSEPHTGPRPSVRLCVRQINEIHHALV